MKKYVGYTALSNFKGTLKASDIKQMQENVVAPLMSDTFRVASGFNLMYEEQGYVVGPGILIGSEYPASMEQESYVDLSVPNYIIFTKRPTEERTEVIDGTPYTYFAYLEYLVHISNNPNTQYPGEEVITQIPLLLKVANYDAELVRYYGNEADGDVATGGIVQCVGADKFLLVRGAVIYDDKYKNLGSVVSGFVVLGTPTEIEQQDIVLRIKETPNIKSGRLRDILSEMATKINSLQKVAFDGDYNSLEQPIQSLNRLVLDLEKFSPFCLPDLPKGQITINEALSRIIRVLDPLKAPRDLTTLVSVTQFGRVAYDNAPDGNLIFGTPAGEAPAGYLLADGTSNTVNYSALMNSMGVKIYQKVVVKDTHLDYTAQNGGLTDVVDGPVKASPIFTAYGTHVFYPSPNLGYKFKKVTQVWTGGIIESTNPSFTLQTDLSISCTVEFEKACSIYAYAMAEVLIPAVKINSSADSYAKEVMSLEAMSIHPAVRFLTSYGAKLLYRVIADGVPVLVQRAFYGSYLHPIPYTEVAGNITVYPITYEVRGEYLDPPTVSVDIIGEGVYTPTAPTFVDEYVVDVQPAPGWVFKKAVYTDASGMKESESFPPQFRLLPGDNNVKVFFEAVVTIMVETVGGQERGTISIDNGTPVNESSLEVEAGTSVSLQAFPAFGYAFSRWESSLGKIYLNNTQTITAESDEVIKAVFTEMLATVEINFDPLQGSALGAGVYRYGTQATVSAVPAVGYTFARWVSVIGGIEYVMSTQPTYPFVATAPNLELRAIFTRSTYLVSTEVEGSGTVTGSGVYNYGATANFTATAALGRTFAGWYNGIFLLTTNPNYSTVVYGPLTLKAKFEISQYTISVFSDNPAMGTVAGNGVYAYQATAPLRAYPNAGYTFKEWQLDGTPYSTDPSIDLEVTEDLVLVAIFIPE